MWRGRVNPWNTIIWYDITNVPTWDFILILQLWTMSYYETWREGYNNISDSGTVKPPLKFNLNDNLSMFFTLQCIRLEDCVEKGVLPIATDSN